MAENPGFEHASTPSAQVQRIRTKLAAAGHTARRTMGRLSGGNKPAVEDKPSPEVQSAPVASPDDPAIGLWGTLKRARLAILITVTVAQVAIAVIAWRVRVGRARRRGEPIDI